MERTIRIQTVEGGIGRTIVGRLYPGTDLLSGIREACRQHNVEYGMISCAIGCLDKATFIFPIPNLEAKIGIVYCDPVVVEGPAEFLGGQGVICQSEDNQYLIHFHGSVSDQNMRVWGGHFIHDGNIVLATIDFVIHEITNVNMMRRYDEETGFVQFCPEGVRCTV